MPNRWHPTATSIENYIKFKVAIISTVTSTSAFYLIRYQSGDDDDDDLRKIMPKTSY